MKDGTEPHGLFTLVLRRMGGAWRIVHDHTSSGE
jgi:ketosteroid isomerase-like protein